MKKFLGTFSLVMITVGSVDSIRNLPATALFGSNIIAFFVLAAIFFLVPSGLMSAQLASQSQEGEGGVYRWVTQAFGKPAGFLAIWYQWIENVVYYPALLAYIAGTVAYLVDPALLHSKIYLMVFILAAFWAITLLNLLGMKSSSVFANVCGFFGLVLPMCLIIAMGAVWVFSGKPIHVDLSPHALIPNFAHPTLWVTLSGVMLSMCGMEIATIHVRETKDPQKTFPRALMISTVFILATLIMGALAIAIVVPAHHLSLIAGIMQAFHVFFAAYHLSWLLPLLGVVLIIGGMGGLNNWLIAPTRGLHYAGGDGHLPKWMLTENKFGAPNRLLLVQAVIVTICLLIFVLLPSINDSYWYLNVLAAQLYMFMYLLMFAAGIKLKWREKRTAASSGYRIPGGKMGTLIVGVLGLTGGSATIAIGFFAPSGIHFVNGIYYALIVLAGLVVMTIPAFLLLVFCYGKNQK